MDKNSWIGFVLILGILITFSIIQRPSKEQLAEQKRIRDSIAVAQQMERQAEQLSVQISQQLAQEAQQAAADSSTNLTEKVNKLYGEFAPAALGKDSLVILENTKLRLQISTHGGCIEAVELKDYRTYGDTLHPLRLFDKGDSRLAFSLVTNSNRIVSTDRLFFSPVRPNDSTLILRLPTVYETAYIDFKYTLHKDDYLVDFAIAVEQPAQVLAANMRSLELQWEQLIPQQERGRNFEERYAQLQYMLTDGDIEKLSEQKHDQQKETTHIKWIAYKDQFFSTVLIAQNSFSSALFESTPKDKTSPYIKEYKTSTSVDFNISAQPATSFKYYFGPNHYNTLKAYDKRLESGNWHLQELVPLGWKIVSWINKLLVIPMFDLFSDWHLHIGVIILLMTLVIKIIILPFVFASYKSSAKMRVLKPQIDAINTKYPMDKMQERQQATMALYSKAGVSPMSGCLPMLFQFPVLMAMFWFFPTAIELRGQSLFWADDLSTYDAVFSWSHHIPLLGDHLSLFCLLMTICNFVYTYITMQNQATDPNMKFMRWMMYLMPLMFLFIFNDYAAGLSYYYLLSLFFTIFQTMLFRLAIDDKKLLQQMEENAKKRQTTKKSGFMERLAQMQREQIKNARQQAKQNAKKLR